MNVLSRPQCWMPVPRRANLSRRIPKRMPCPLRRSLLSRYHLYLRVLLWISGVPHLRLARQSLPPSLQRTHSSKAPQLSGPLTPVFPTFFSWALCFRYTWLPSPPSFDVPLFPIQRHSRGPGFPPFTL